MSAEDNTKEKTSIYPAELDRFFRKPPLRLSEYNKVYEDLYQSTKSAMDPQNNMEQLLVTDVVNLTFELAGSAKDKASFVNMTWKAAIRMLLEALQTEDPDGWSAQERAEAFFLNDEGRLWVLTQLEEYGLTIDAIAAQATTMRRPEIECINRQMDRVRAARLATMREYLVYRHAGIWKGPKDLLAVIDAKANLIPLAPTVDPVTAE
jgi:hypothetical protein